MLKRTGTGSGCKLAVSLLALKLQQTGTYSTAAVLKANARAYGLGPGTLVFSHSKRLTLATTVLLAIVRVVTLLNYNYIVIV